MSPALRLLAAAGAAVVLAACASTPAASGVQNSVPAAGAAPITGAIDAAGAPYVASRRTKKVYPAGCATVALIKQPDRVGFASLKAAQDAGFAKDVYSTDCQY